MLSFAKVNVITLVCLPPVRRRQTLHMLLFYGPVESYHDENFDAFQENQRKN